MGPAYQLDPKTVIRPAMGDRMSGVFGVSPDTTQNVPVLANQS